ncbi:unnamed protein product [Dibothriocephalus latus]|uniref:Uncharacterized protein n=1 Tax=Dibothriocephalus latus TaxID=60516 RepID=A0A3P7LIZ6_DIBLA|nr:unnamed protein product [Dibothriocephalus latus]
MYQSSKKQQQSIAQSQQQQQLSQPSFPQSATYEQQQQQQQAISGPVSTAGHELMSSHLSSPSSPSAKFSRQSGMAMFCPSKMYCDQFLMELRDSMSQAIQGTKKRGNLLPQCFLIVGVFRSTLFFPTHKT